MLAPEGRRFIARGVNPWSAGALPRSIQPRRGGGEPLSQGFTPLAMDRRPSRANNTAPCVKTFVSGDRATTGADLTAFAVIIVGEFDANYRRNRNQMVRVDGNDAAAKMDAP